MKKIDLHMHTNFSDGDYSPEKLIDYAIEKGLTTIAITDHDVIGALSKALEYAKDKEITVIPGVELTCQQGELELGSIHVLGYFINYNNNELKQTLEWLKEARVKQKRAIIEKLNALNYDITFEELKKEANESLGRPHIAKILMRKYPFNSVSEVFDELIGHGKKAYVKQEKISIKKSIDIIHNAGGIAILAHPGIYNLEVTDKLIDLFIKYGGDGLEVYYPYNKICSIPKEASDKIIQIIKDKAIQHNTLITGGSDFHGPSRPVEIGEEGITEKYFILLKKS